MISFIWLYSLWNNYIDTEGIMIKKAAVVFTVMLLGGCVSAPDKAELSRADYGKLPDNYQEIIKGSMSARLKDPYSARYDFNEPFKGWCKSGFTTYYGWLVPFTLNAKNSYGGYVGNKSYLYLVNKNNAIDYTASFQVGGCGKS
ncbi:TPA: hypothetical protein MAQ12_003925 [Klebsiella pneumoniae]|uniref:Uncharacterized protein n=3 Tax=Klebsiella/Raoultella group TaxID=2890311 RepID=A0A6B2J2B4_KLEPN|nr:hypothetical protein [Klebsiella pneumoniae]MBZ6710174.1 hypothetical protein [Klebsiella quasipneumoniae]MPT46476.1 hypothetical protein [Klebsiella sp.]PJR65032.1 hypothetical protein CWM61_09320 [Klebsiella sp. K-Nf6]PXK37499.1 hypothetical protein DMR24_14490 [Klebsiella variicola]THI56609.1 hypothetical protein E9149_06530 [Klebsiella pneumoniae subsp. pneumoniae]HBS1068504.1 hypothetical protein [Klebsiella quasipneumoniae subsp. similipneumoniae]HCB1268563.1 hypothetical protein [K